LALSTDGDVAIKIMGAWETAETLTGFYSSDSPWYSLEAAKASPTFDGVDMDAAKELMDAYINDPARSDEKTPGDKVTLAYSCVAVPALMDLAQVQQAVWGELGVELEIQSVELAAMTERLVGSADTDPSFKGSFQINCSEQGGGADDPLSVFRRFFGPVATSPSNITNYTNPEIDEQLEILQKTTDFATRYAAVEKIQTIAAEDVPLIWFFVTPAVVGHKDSINGVADWQLPSGSTGEGTPDATVRFHQVWLED